MSDISNNPDQYDVNTAQAGIGGARTLAYKLGLGHMSDSALEIVMTGAQRGLSASGVAAMIRGNDQEKMEELIGRNDPYALHELAELGEGGLEWFFNKVQEHERGASIKADASTAEQEAQANVLDQMIMADLAADLLAPPDEDPFWGWESSENPWDWEPTQEGELPPEVQALYDAVAAEGGGAPPAEVNTPEELLALQEQIRQENARKYAENEAATNALLQGAGELVLAGAAAHAGSTVAGSGTNTDTSAPAPIDPHTITARAQEMDNLLKAIQGPISSEDLEHLAEAHGFKPDALKERALELAELQAQTNPGNPNNLKVQNNNDDVTPAYIAYGLSTPEEIAKWRKTQEPANDPQGPAPAPGTQPQYAYQQQPGMNPNMWGTG